MDIIGDAQNVVYQCKSVDATLIKITHPTIQSGISSTNPTVNPPTPRRCIEGFRSQELKSFQLQVLQQTYSTMYISILYNHIILLWLVVFRHPSETWWSLSVGMILPNIWKKSNMFQTTNQYYILHVYQYQYVYRMAWKRKSSSDRRLLSRSKPHGSHDMKPLLFVHFRAVQKAEPDLSGQEVDTLHNAHIKGQSLRSKFRLRNFVFWVQFQWDLRLRK